MVNVIVNLVIHTYLVALSYQSFWELTSVFRKKKKNQQLELSTITMHQAETLNPLPGQLTESSKSAYATLLLLSSLSRVKGKRKHQLRPGTIG